MSMHPVVLQALEPSQAHVQTLKADCIGEIELQIGVQENVIHDALLSIRVCEMIQVTGISQRHER